MLRSNILPDAIKFLGLLSTCRHLGLVDERKRFFQLVSEENGMVRHCGCLVDLRRRADLLEEARDLIDSSQASGDLITSHRLQKISCNWTLSMADVIQLHPTCTQQQAYTRKPWKKGMR